MIEIWKDINNFEGKYQISNLGRVKSLSRSVGNGFRVRTLPDRIMVNHQWFGYEVIWLRKPGVHKKFRIHQLVAQAFLPAIAGKNFVNHKDKNRTNNTVENLEWCTHEENCAHRDGRVCVVSDEPF